MMPVCPVLFGARPYNIPICLPVTSSTANPFGSSTIRQDAGKRLGTSQGREACSAKAPARAARESSPPRRHWGSGAVGGTPFFPCLLKWKLQYACLLQVQSAVYAPTCFLGHVT